MVVSGGGLDMGMMVFSKMRVRAKIVRMKFSEGSFSKEKMDFLPKCDLFHFLHNKINHFDSPTTNIKIKTSIVFSSPTSQLSKLLPNPHPPSSQYD